MARIRYNKNVNISKVVSKLVMTVLALYVGGIIMDVFGDVINGTTSGFYKGLTLLGWTVDATNTVTATADGAILTVIGVIGLATVVMEFISFG